MEFLTLAKERYSVRKFKEDPIEDDKLNKILKDIDNIYKVNNKVDVSIDVDPVRL